MKKELTREVSRYDKLVKRLEGEIILAVWKHL